MPVYLIDYDLNSPGQDYTKLIKKIMEFPAYCSNLIYSWAIYYNGSSKDVLNSIAPFLDSSDRVIISRLNDDSIWYLDKEKSEWITNHSSHP